MGIENKALGMRVRVLRKRRDITLKQLAARLSISYQQLQKYEKGKNRISATMLHDIAMELSISVETIYSGETAEEVLGRLGEPAEMVVCSNYQQGKHNDVPKAGHSTIEAGAEMKSTTEAEYIPTAEAPYPPLKARIIGNPDNPT